MFRKGKEPKYFDICKKCGKEFNKYPIIDGIKRDFRKRHYCMECVPFLYKKNKDLNCLVMIRRFWSHVDIKEDADQCWLWKLKLDRGYGSFSFNKIKTGSHRVAYILTFGEISDDLLVCHKCDVRNCCNPNHLFLGTIDDNNKDRKNKGGYATGKDHWMNKKLKQEEVIV